MLNPFDVDVDIMDRNDLETRSLSIGAKITTEQRKLYDELEAQLGMSDSELVRFALGELLKASGKGDNRRLADELERARLQDCPLFRALQKQLFGVKEVHDITSPPSLRIANNEHMDES